MKVIIIIGELNASCLLSHGEILNLRFMKLFRAIRLAKCPTVEPYIDFILISDDKKKVADMTEADWFKSALGDNIQADMARYHVIIENSLEGTISRMFKSIGEIKESTKTSPGNPMEMPPPITDSTKIEAVVIHSFRDEDLNPVLTKEGQDLIDGNLGRFMDLNLTLHNLYRK